MKKKFLIIIVFIQLLGCGKQVNDDNGVSIILDEKQKKNTVLLAEIADKIEVISLKTPDDILFGEVEHIKTSNNYLALFDREQTKSLTIFNHKGEFVNQLRKIGQGPGEYSDITDFTFNAKGDHVYIYDRNFNAINSYSFPDLYFEQKVPTHMYLMGIDIIENSFLAVSDEKLTDKEEYGVGYISIDTLKKSFSFNPIPVFSNMIPVVEVSFPNTFSRNKNGLVYAMNVQYPKIYQIRDKEVQPVATVDFGAHKIPSKYWDETKNSDFEEAFSVPPLKSDWVQNVIVTDSVITFYYMHGNPDNRQIAIYDRKSKKASVIYKIRIAEKCGVLPYALGVHKDFFLTLLYPDDLKELFPNGISEDSPQWVKDTEKSLKEEKVVCLKYKIK